MRINRLTGGVSVVPGGPTLMVPLVHELRRYSLRDQVYRPQASATAAGAAPFQSVEGLSIGLAVTVRYALDLGRVGEVAKRLPANVAQDLIEPVVDGVLHHALSRHTVREIFSDKRAEIQDDIQAELQDLLGKDGITVRSLYLGHVDLPEQYRAGLEGMLSEELASETMRYTLQLKGEEARKESELEGDAAKIQREKAAAEAFEEIIAAKGTRGGDEARASAQGEGRSSSGAWRPRRAQGQQRMDAEGEAEARKIETVAEVDSRRKLSEADAYRIEVTGKANSAQMARRIRRYRWRIRCWSNT